ncbi:hypothetical protein LIER_28238 [Lithospermum erythrorhizon]|uniref:DUF4283 domain-containing protein n=1 Tax=Lithospermum erythrorhizon TaxID=34254 RepID=A0AAV3RG55_LITER
MPQSFESGVKSGQDYIESHHGIPDFPSKSITIYQGKPAVSFHNSDISKLLEEMKYMLVDVSKPFSDAIWISIVDEVSKVTLDGFWVKVLYDMVPPYCKACSHIGHGMEACKLKNADQLSNDVPSSSEAANNNYHHDRRRKHNQFWMESKGTGSLKPQLQNSSYKENILSIENRFSSLDLPSTADAQDGLADSRDKGTEDIISNQKHTSSALEKEVEQGTSDLKSYRAIPPEVLVPGGLLSEQSGEVEVELQFKNVDVLKMEKTELIIEVVVQQKLGTVAELVEVLGPISLIQGLDS